MLKEIPTLQSYLSICVGEMTDIIVAIISGLKPLLKLIYAPDL